MKTCLFCGSGYFDNEKKCVFCHRSGVNGELMGSKVEYRRRALICPTYQLQFWLLMIPALMMLFLGVLLFMSNYTDLFIFTFLPELGHSEVLSLLCILGALIMLTVSICRRAVNKKAYGTYCNLLLVDEKNEAPTNVSLKAYYKFEKMILGKSMFLLFIPVVIYIFMISFIYYADHYAFMLIFNKFYVILPDVSDCNAFTFFMYVFPSVGIIAHITDFIISLVHQIRYKKDEKEALALNADLRISEDAEYGDGEEETEEGDGLTVGDNSIPFAFEDGADGYGQDQNDPFHNLKLVDEIMGQTVIAPTTEMTPGALCERLKLCLAHRGLDLSDDKIFSLLSSMAAYRLISFNIEPQYMEAVYGALSECFGFDEGTITYSDQWNEEKDLMFTVQDEQTVESPYLNALYLAQYKPAYVCAVNIEDADANRLCTMMQEFSAYSKNPGQKRSIPLLSDYNSAIPKKVVQKAAQNSYAKDTYLQLSQNVWCFLSQEKGKQTYVSLDVLTEGRSINLMLTGQKKRDLDELSPVEGMPISYQSFLTIIKNACQKTYLSEDHWKKFDKLEAFLEERVGFIFGNRLSRKMETYADVYLACGGDATHAIDHLLENILATVLSFTDIEMLRAVDGKMSLFEFMDKTFGSDTIPCCHRLLSTFGLDS